MFSCINVKSVHAWILPNHWSLLHTLCIIVIYTLYFYVSYIIEMFFQSNFYGFSSCICSSDWQKHPHLKGNKFCILWKKRHLQAYFQLIALKRKHFKRTHELPSLQLLWLMLPHFMGTSIHYVKVGGNTVKYNPQSPFPHAYARTWLAVQFDKHVLLSAAR